MQICDNKHDEISHEGTECPLCTLRDDLEYQLETANKEIQELEQKLERAES